MPPKLTIAPGTRFGRWTAQNESGRDPHGAVLIECRCDCGTVRAVKATALHRGDSRSCGCASADAQVTHGMSKSSLYGVWRGIRQRTGDPNHREYANYGGRGIRMSARWDRFEIFAADMAAGYRPGLQIDRIDNDGPYAPQNCRWVEPATNQRNKRTNHRIEWRGRTLIVQEWAELLGLNSNTIVHRLRRGWSVDRALSEGADPRVLLELANGAPA
jgi:hypothetical protein